MLGSKAILEGRTHLPRMEEDSEILEPEEIEALVEHLPPRHILLSPPSLNNQLFNIRMFVIHNRLCFYSYA